MYKRQVLLNKSDLVCSEELLSLQDRVRGLNRLAQIHHTVQGAVDIDQVLGIRAFDLEARAAEMPDFLKEELPFEWAGLYDLAVGDYQLDLAPGPDPTIDLVLGGPGLDNPGVFDRWKRESILLYSSDPKFLQPDSELLAGDTLYRLAVDDSNGATTVVRVEKPGRYVLFTQHLPEEFGLSLNRAGNAVRPIKEYHYASPHEHDNSVGSIGIQLPGDLDPDRFEAWMVDLLRRRGTDIFRAKGVLSLAGDAQRFVFQGVHMLFDGQAGRPWEPGTERGNQLVFIGRELERDELTEGLRACLA